MEVLHKKNGEDFKRDFSKPEDLHSPSANKGCPQDEFSECPTQRLWPIQCLCIAPGLPIVFHISPGPALSIVPSNLLKNWQAGWGQWFGADELCQVYKAFLEGPNVEDRQMSVTIGSYSNMQICIGHYACLEGEVE